MYMRAWMEPYLVWHTIEEGNVAFNRMDRISEGIFTNANVFYLLTRQRNRDTFISGEQMFFKAPLFNLILEQAVTDGVTAIFL